VPLEIPGTRTLTTELGETAEIFSDRYRQKHIFE